MDIPRFDRSVNDVAQATGRRDAVRSLATSGVALLGAIGLGEASANEQGRSGGQSSKRGKRKKKRSRAGFTFAARVEISAPSDPLLAAAGSLVSATAECGGQGKVVSCGYQTGADAEENVNVLVQAVLPDDERSSCFASLLRTVEVGSSTSFGATIQAVAVCLA